MEQTGHLLNVWWSFAFISAGGLLFGYLIGINSNVIAEGQLQCSASYTGPAGTWSSWGYGQCYHLTPPAQGVISSLNLVGACASSLVCFRYADSIGRKMEMQIAGTLYCIGSVFAAAVPMLWGVYVGLLTYGLGIGFAMHAAPVYIAEISPTEVRGMLVSCKEAVIVLGIFLGFLSGWSCSALGSGGWRLMILCSGVLALVMLMGIAGVPQSPRFLALRVASRGRGEGEDEAVEAERKEAISALQFLRRASAEEVEQELETILQDVKVSLADQEDAEALPLLRPPASPSRWTGKLRAFQYPRPMILGCGLVVLEQVTGQPSVLYFATKIFLCAGFGNSAALPSVGIGLVKLIATLITVWKVDDYGRRLLLFVGISMMALHAFGL
uniref:Hexose transporter 1 n=1 Tax=Alexandrium monilatum TaxID=311494 RepID=A0A7S4R3L6_9DINO